MYGSEIPNNVRTGIEKININRTPNYIILCTYVHDVIDPMYNYMYVHTHVRTYVHGREILIDPNNNV